jgi:hypothetical protein
MSGRGAKKRSEAQQAENRGHRNAFKEGKMHIFGEQRNDNAR